MTTRVIVTETDRKTLLTLLRAWRLPFTIDIVEGRRRSVEQNDEFLSEHKLTKRERELLVWHLAALRARRTVEALLAIRSRTKGAGL